MTSKDNSKLDIAFFHFSFIKLPNVMNRFTPWYEWEDKYSNQNLTNRDITNHMK